MTFQHPISAKNKKPNQSAGHDEMRNYFFSSERKSRGATNTYMSRRTGRKKSCQAGGGEPKDVRRGRALAVMRIDCMSGGRGGSGVRDSAARLDLLSSAPQWQPIIRQRAGGQIWEMSEEDEAKGEEGRW